MKNKYTKRSEKILSNLAKLSKVENNIVKIEKKTGLPSKFKIPKVKIKW